MRGERSKAVRAVKQKYELEDDEVSEVSVADDRFEDEASDTSTKIPYERLEDSYEDNSVKAEEKKRPANKGRPYKVCGGKAKDRKGIMASSFKELVEKGERKVYQSFNKRLFSVMPNLQAFFI